ncbi:MAG: hypothetical protein GVY36_17140 [Verrucomicrobia bacterium]|jgi:hypothetical protein|nr:hypothetical protein [Verrucomicrobiota bacterium]
MSRRSQSQINLYSFQDIVTATIGILLITVLVLLLSIITTRTKEAGEVKEIVEQQAQKVEEIENTYNQLKEQVGISNAEATKYHQLRKRLAAYMNAELESAELAQYRLSRQKLKLRVPKTEINPARTALIVATVKGVYLLSQDGRLDSEILDVGQIEAITKSGGYDSVVALFTPDALNTKKVIAGNQNRGDKALSALLSLHKALQTKDFVMRDVIPHADFLITLSDE